MSKNLVLCCDGTNNQFSGHHTNVIRTYKSVLRSESQLSFYDCGVGTMPEPWAQGRLGRQWSMVKGLAFGSGFMQNIEDAYRFLVQHYKPNDNVFLFGFSRGAYTVRALAGMLHSVGLLHQGAEHLIPYAQRYWQQDFRPSNDSLPKTQGQVLCEEFKATLSRSCPVHFIGAWDTVSSVGFINQFRTFPFTANNREVTHVRHAASIDERRSCFRQNLMYACPSGQDVKNVWFAGVHSDVGGGYPPAESGLAKISFDWMMREARRCGLQIDEAALTTETHAGAAPNPLAEQHESLAGGWRLAELVPVRRYSRATGEHSWRWPLGEARNVLRDAAREDVFLHESVLDRMRGREDYRPTNLPHDPPKLESIFKIER